MGLDIFFEKRKRDYDFSNRNELREEIIASDPRKEIAYFRKVNFLMTYFDYEGNCEYKLIGKEEIEELIDRCKKVLDNHELAAELLPTTGGFFFGSTDYNEWYFNDVESVRTTFEGILENVDWETEVVEMYCWW